MTLVRLIFFIALLFLVGIPARGEAEKLKPEDPQRSELEGKAFKAKKVVPDAFPDRPIPQLYRAWPNPSPRPNRPGEALLSFSKIQPPVKRPEGELSAWHKKKWESGKPVRSAEVNKDFVIVLDPFTLKDFNRLVYKRNRIRPSGGG
ncbi:MAG: hypothetical protein F7O42_13570 [Opitutae bacterium]|nr:hypothetical protein [Opitutae bacterium]